MSELLDKFNELKSLIHKEEDKKFSLSDIARLIKKKNKTKEEYKILIETRFYVKTMLLSIEDLGTKILELNYDKELEESSKGLSYSKNIQIIIKEILVLIDQYIDALSAMIRVYEYNEEKLQLKDSEHYLKAFRSKLIEEAHQYNSIIIEEHKEEQKEEIIHFLNNLIDVMAKTSYSLRLIKLYEALSNI